MNIIIIAGTPYLLQIKKKKHSNNLGKSLPTQINNSYEDRGSGNSSYEQTSDKHKSPSKFHKQRVFDVTNNRRNSEDFRKPLVSYPVGNRKIHGNSPLVSQLKSPALPPLNQKGNLIPPNLSDSITQISNTSILDKQDSSGLGYSSYDETSGSLLRQSSSNFETYTSNQNSSAFESGGSSIIMNQTNSSVFESGGSIQIKQTNSSKKSNSNKRNKGVVAPEICTPPRQEHVDELKQRNGIVVNRYKNLPVPFPQPGPGIVDQSKHYEIPYNELRFGRCLGEGAFGRVYEGRWNGTPVACKVLVCQMEESIINDFKCEIGVLSMLRHPNICLFMGACTINPNFVIVSELVSRGSLWNLLHTPSIRYLYI